MAIPDTTDTCEPEEATTEVARPRGLTPRERFDNLPQHLRDAILDKRRDWNTEHFDWWEGVYEQFGVDMAEIGIEVERMYFSGFWSQGDGACFEGRVADWSLFLGKLGYSDAALINHAVDWFRFDAKHSGHYYHENCTRFDSNLPLPENDEDAWFILECSTYERGSLHEAVWMANLNKYTWATLEKQFVESFKDHMRDLYSRLEEEYDYLTSDKAILESLDANDVLDEEINQQLEHDNA